jgi:aryl-alcohol dehydrogenase-like predicted oxidoreductase
VSSSRKNVIAASGHLNLRAIGIAQEVRALAEEIGATPRQIALAWTLANPVVASPIMGARTDAQAEENLAALELVLSPAQHDRLNRISEPDTIFPARFVQRPLVQQLIHGGASVPRRI